MSFPSSKAPLRGHHGNNPQHQGPLASRPGAHSKVKLPVRDVDLKFLCAHQSVQTFPRLQSYYGRRYRVKAVQKAFRWSWSGGLVIEEKLGNTSESPTPSREFGFGSFRMTLPHHCMSAF